MSTTTLLSAAPASPAALALPVTLVTAALCTGLQVVLTALVIARRAHSGVGLLDGGDAVLTRRMRAHGNFTEIAPLALLLMGLVELAAAPRSLLLGLAGLLIVGRLLHAGGVLSRGDGWARRLGMVATLWSLSLLGVASFWYGLRAW